MAPAARCTRADKSPLPRRRGWDATIITVPVLFDVVGADCDLPTGAAGVSDAAAANSSAGVSSAMRAAITAAKAAAVPACPLCAASSAAVNPA